MASSPSLAPPAAPSLMLIAGPTASGKSALALALARALADAARPACIVNADASQVYADIPLLSAQPDAADRAAAPHALFGHVDAGAPYDVARWCADARSTLGEAQGAGVVPILVGGTGLYLRTLLDGIAPVPPIDPQVRARVRSLPVAAAHAELARADPAAAARLAPADTTRVQRALEVVASTGVPLARWQERREGGIAGDWQLIPLILLPPRDWLAARCDARVQAMADAGALDEARRLAARNLDPALPAMRAIGVPQFSAAAEGAIAIEEAIAATRLATRQYAKRQYTWFRNQPPPDWPRLESPLNSDSINDIVIKLRSRLLTA